MCKPDMLHRWELKVYKDGRPLCVWDRAGAMTGLASHASVPVICENIFEAHLLPYQLSHQASHDNLTGLVNRRVFERLLQRILKSAREDQSEHALSYLDFD